MILHKLRPEFLLMATCLSLASTALAQTQLVRSVVSNGGVVANADSGRLIATAGQPIIGITANETTHGYIGFWYQNIDLVTSIMRENEAIPEDFQLDQNYPNPFNPSTTIRFALPVSAKVSLTLFDILGRRVATLVDEELEAGTHNVVFEAAGLPSGIYFYRLNTEGFVKTKKFTLLK